ncbi:maltokinase N-terminal cap-like domain-containing protein [Streptomyces sp. SHP 1-2]|uniref:maltokinase N-terminal cap-like domain-containing protein n=1 Tax=Streptomyces sp. SHP 1-2 TaxID=2769489 RepID=UPI002237C72F|nr:1,4-alpha-glucan branching protein [Streptomyces sp. SHP 1-2]MCW5253016.1 1,4-alpha-glucan branching protein [Streptomyces sp. SHP 1-2]
MAVIHQTVLKPDKMELLAAWLPSRPWYRGGAEGPEPVKAGGFRLDDPRGAVGIEFMMVNDVSGLRPAAYLVPLAYRGAPLDGAAEEALIGVAEHGVLGRRWVYDALRDPVAVAQLVALLEGRTRAQHQDLSDTPDDELVLSRAEDAAPGAVDPAAAEATDDAEGTVLTFPRGAALRLHRALRPAPGDAPAAPEGTSRLTGVWTAGDDRRVRGLLAVLRTGPRP